MRSNLVAFLTVPVCSCDGIWSHTNTASETRPEIMQETKSSSELEIEWGNPAAPAQETMQLWGMWVDIASYLDIDLQLDCIH